MRRAPAGGAATNGNHGTSEATPLPVASQEILTSLNCTVAGIEDPRSGKIALGMQFVLPPLTVDGVKWFTELAPYLRELAQALPNGRVFILDADVADRMRASFNWSHGELRAGWAQRGIGGSLLILAKLLAKQLTVDEAIALTLGMPADAGLEAVPALRGSIAANLFELTDADRDALLTVSQRLEAAIVALTPSLEDYLDNGDDPAKLWSVEDVGRYIAQAVEQLRVAQLAIAAARAVDASTAATDTPALRLADSAVVAIDGQRKRLGDEGELVDL